MAYDYDLESLITLCYKCHAEEESKLKTAPIDLMNAMRAAGVGGSEIEELTLVFGNLKNEPTKTKAIIDLIFRLSDCDIKSVSETEVYAEKLRRANP